MRIESILTKSLLALVTSVVLGHICEAKVLSNKDIIVTPPSTMDATFTVTGTPGANQTDDFIYRRFEVDANEMPVAFSAVTNQYGKLNQKISLRSGHYIVGYSGSTTSIKIKPKDNAVVNLKVITVPAVPNENVRASVFNDLSDLQMQSRDLLSSFLVVENQEKMSVYCKYGYSKACTKFSSPDELLGSFFRYTSDSFLEFYIQPMQVGTSGHWGDKERLYVGSLTDGEFISVFAGTYGITWLYEDNRTEDTYGQVIN